MQSVRLLQFSDTHLSADPDASVRGIAGVPALRSAINDAHRRFSHHDAVLLTGDLVQDDPAGYVWIKQAFGQSRVPVLCLPGNHDVPEQMRAALDVEPFRVCGAHQFDRWVVVMLDSGLPLEAAGQLGAEQLAQLAATLQAHRNSHALVCLHHHPIQVGSRWLDQVGLKDSEAFLQVIRAHSNVRGVLWGHVHQALDAFIQGVRFMATPSTCAQFLPGSEDFAIDSRPPGYRTLELMPDGSIVSEVCWLESYAQRSSLSG
jgi:3',5'-cyclic-AMP phosphodiesterase